MRAEIIKAHQFLASLRTGDEVTLFRDGRLLDVTVQRPLHKPDPGGFGSTEASRVTVGFGPGRWNTEVTVQDLADHPMRLVLTNEQEGSNA